MSFDLPFGVERELEEYARAERISPADAATVLIMSGLKAKARRENAVEPLAEDEIKQFEAAFPTLGLLDDVTDEQWDRVLKSKQRLSEEGLPVRA